MRTTKTLAILTLVAFTACSGDDAPADDTGNGSSSGTGGDELVTTLPITATFGDDSITTSADTTSPSTTSVSTDTGNVDSSGGDTATSTTTGGDTTGVAESTDTGPGVWDVDWCRLQYPPAMSVAIGEAFTVYGRVYAAGLTDQTTGTDTDPQLVAEVGWGEDGTLPFIEPWTWISAGPNIGYDDSMGLGEPNNDEYQADLVIDQAGTFDYAFRFSGDGGMNWVYCDLDDVLTDGYTADQAGSAEVGP